jgi:hypothetical protein
MAEQRDGGMVSGASLLLVLAQSKELILQLLAVIAVFDVLLVLVEM